MAVFMSAMLARNRSHHLSRNTRTGVDSYASQDDRSGQPVRWVVPAGQAE